MLSAKSGKKDRQFVVQLVGAVDDQADLDKAIGPLPEPPFEMHVNCSQIDRINSVGVKGWIKYFQKVQEKRIPVFFYDCAPPIVQQMNLVFNFTCGGKVISLKLPFACESCEHNYVQSITVQALRQINFAVPNQKCPKCGKQDAAFDDIPKMYFKFLMSPK